MHYDLVIIGGGLVGATLARALGDSGLRIALVEAVPFAADHQPSYDARAIALAYASRRVLEGLGLWQPLAPQCTPIEHIHVSDRGHFGATRLDAREQGVEALGYVVEARALGQVLWSAVAQCAGVELMCPAALDHIEFTVQGVQVTLQDGRCLETRLVVAADGARSEVREQLGMPVRCWDYRQSAVVTTVTAGRPQAGLAFERFTDEGPVALLPLAENRYAVIWTVAAPRADGVLALDDAAFLAQLQERFGNRLGRLTRLGSRHAYPLVLRVAHEAVGPRLALVGNALHSLHPIAGQGFNLGVRDVAALAQVLWQAKRAGEDIGSAKVLDNYVAWRSADQRKVTLFTDALVRLFSNGYLPLAAARGLSMMAVDLMPPLKSLLARHAMGVAGRQPQLCLGLPLGDASG